MVESCMPSPMLDLWLSLKLSAFPFFNLRKLLTLPELSMASSKPQRLHYLNMFPLVSEGEVNRGSAVKKTLGFFIPLYPSRKLRHLGRRQVSVGHRLFYLSWCLSLSIWGMERKMVHIFYGCEITWVSQGFSALVLLTFGASSFSGVGPSYAG